MADSTRLTSNTRATVRLELEVPILNNYLGERTIDEVYASAKEAALIEVHKVAGGRARVIGTPVVTAIMVDAK